MQILRTPNSPARIAETLLGWYDRHARILPWRNAMHASNNGYSMQPYHIWLSEVMLQQTQIVTVRDYFLRFIKKWPTIEALAAAETDDVMKAWAGLGYYSRARNLKKSAEIIAKELDGKFPENARDLQKLPGIGEYTAAAIAAIAFHEKIAVVDGNVERVITRLYAIASALPGAKPEIRRRTQAMVPKSRPGDFAQAMMDLGATICSPRRPACPQCPLANYCMAYSAGNAQDYPIKVRRAGKPTRRGAAFVAIRSDGAVYLRKRPEQGLLGGMSEVPSTGWSVAKDGATGIESAPFAANWHYDGMVRHSFTHFNLELEIWHAREVDIDADSHGWWSSTHELSGEALPSIMKKAIAAAIPGAFQNDPVK
jgi:A/G-specific adenine glycosylase